jgi:hypothetical protein
MDSQYDREAMNNGFDFRAGVPEHVPLRAAAGGW